MMIVTSVNKDQMMNKETPIQYLEIEGTTYFKIEDVNQFPPFFMSIVSSGNHWMFISSNGGLSAGRKDAESALFPYYTVDKISESAEFTGSKSILRVKKEETHIWEPFSFRFNKKYRISRNLYKSLHGNTIIFEEINHSLSLSFSYKWNSSAKYGFIKTSYLKNLAELSCEIDFLDGIQNIMPQGVGSDLQNAASNLVDAYKRSEIDASSGVGIYALSAMIVDKAEPREALKANVVWSLGFSSNEYLLSSLQLNAFRSLSELKKETDVKGEKGAYFINQSISLEAEETKSWYLIANVNQTQSAVVELIKAVKTNDNLLEDIKQDIEAGKQRLIMLNASADGLQQTTDPLNDARHFSNVLFNIMRGGIFDFNYQIEKYDFSLFVQHANKKVFIEQKELIESLPEKFSLFDLREITYTVNNANFKRIVTEYLPLKFSRRHGDPSRPWNKFSINTQNEFDGSKILDYEGNWRDIFQNWEALAHAFPEFIEGMIFKFLNATTFDGYNPYRVTKDGFDWETIEPDDPWSYIGYWGDHQIIYLLKFLEFIEDRMPGKLDSFFEKEIFVYANVPYRIKPYAAIIKNSKDTIDFDIEADESIRNKRIELGADGALLSNEKRQIHHVNFIEKILATVLAKLSNFIPEGGVWMNTQRPEWNDANNALVGNGVSMVTLYYLHRFLLFFQDLLIHSNSESVKISSELMDFYKGVRKVLLDHEHMLNHGISDKARGDIIDSLGEIASDYRTHIYVTGFWGKKRSISIDGLKNFTRVSIAFIQQSIAANRRDDGMFHAYNLMTRDKKRVSIAHLSEMLEGQVAVLNSKYLQPSEALTVLESLKNSALFRHDQYSYILYPNKELPGFLEKNNIPEEAISSSELLQKLLELDNRQIIEKDVNGQYHFNGNFGYVVDLENALKELKEPVFQTLLKEDKEQVLKIFESVFNHKAFTGRSGTFFGYEGLGSIYWHMVSKLLLAVQECCIQAINEKEDHKTIGKLLEHYYEIQAGIGVHKSPILYGAFPTDPYSHTPAGRGAQQPGMTGQVKEDILTHWGELGIFFKQGELYFHPQLLRRNEFIDKPGVFKFIDVNGENQQLNLNRNTLAFTYCQIPVVYEIATESKIEVSIKSDVFSFDGLKLNQSTSEKVFKRAGEIRLIKVLIEEAALK
jgi:hypothetical protein